MSSSVWHAEVTALDIAQAQSSETDEAERMGEGYQVERGEIYLPLVTD